MPWRLHTLRRSLAYADATQQVTAFLLFHEWYHYVQNCNIAKHFDIKIWISVLFIIPHIMENKRHKEDMEELSENE